VEVVEKRSWSLLLLLPRGGSEDGVLPPKPRSLMGCSAFCVVVEVGIGGAGGIVLLLLLEPAVAPPVTVVVPGPPTLAGAKPVMPDSVPFACVVPGVVVAAVPDGVPVVLVVVVVFFAVELDPKEDGDVYFGRVLLRVLSPQPVRTIPAQTTPIRPTKGFVPIAIPFPV
jgi:hypothetical protein